MLRMGPTPLLIRRDLRRHRALAAAVVVLSVMVGFLGNTAVVLLEQFPRQTEILARRWHTADAIAVFPTTRAPAELERIVRADPSVTGAEASRTLVDKISVPFNGRTLSVMAVVWDADDPGDLGRRTITATAPTAVERPVWMPDLLRAVGGYRAGDTIEITTPAGPETFHIQGFFEDSYFGVPGLQILGIGLPTADFERAWAAAAEPGAHGPGSFPGSARATLVEVDAAGPAEAAALLEDLVEGQIDRTNPMAPFNLTVDLEVLSTATSIPSGILGAILTATALLITLVAVLVIRSTLRSILARDLPALGALRACGFTSGAAARSLTWCFGGLALPAAAAGALGSYAAMPLFTSLVNSQSGTTWTADFSWTGLILTSGVVTAVVLAVSALTVRRLKRTTTVDMLRGGHRAHSFRRSPLPLTTTPGPLSAVLGAGWALQSLRRSITVALTVAVASAVAVSVLGLTSALLGDEDRTLRLISGEIEDLDVHMSAGADAAGARSRVEAVDGVANAYPFVAITPEVDGRETLFLGVDSDADFRFDPVREGRYPAGEDEIVLGAGLARSLGLEVGDTWSVNVGDRRVSFLVTGLATGWRQLGRFAYVTLAGARRIDAQSPAALAVNLVSPKTPGESARVSERIRAALGEDAFVIHDQREAVLLSLDGYLSAVPVMAALVGSFSAVTILMVVVLVVGTLLREERRSLGVRKALGFTRRQLGAQLLWTVLPPVIAGTTAGAAVGALTLGPFIGAILRVVGPLGADARVPPALWAGIPGAVVLVAGLVVTALSLRIRRISTHELVARG